MLPKQLGGVVSSRLVVYGTSNLRVADVSILPMVRTNTVFAPCVARCSPAGQILGTHLMATAYAIGERTADFIKEDYGKLH